MQNRFAKYAAPGQPQQGPQVVGTPRVKPGQAVEIARDEVGYTKDVRSLDEQALDIRDKREKPNKDRMSMEDGLRKEFEAFEPVKNYRSILPQYTAAIQAEDNQAGDLQLVYAFGKIMDPGSVVREGELDMASSAGGLGQRLQGYISGLKGGGRLTPEIRQQLLGEIRTRASQFADAYNQTRSDYSQIVQARGLDPAPVLGTHPGAQFQQAEAGFLGRPIRNLDGSQGAAPAEELPQEVANQRAQNMIGEGRDFDKIAAFLREQNLEFDEAKLREAVNIGRGRVVSGESTGLGIVKGALYPLDRAAEGLQNLSNSVLGTNDDSATQVAQAREEYFASRPTTQGGELLGNIIGGTALTAPFGGPFTQGALAGAALGDSRSVGGVITDGIIGGVGGKIADKAIRGVAGVVSPNLDPAVRRLSAEGVELTPSQIIGGRAKMVEDRATSLPVAGERVMERRAAALDSYNRAGWDRVLKPLGIRLPKNVKAGNDAVRFATDQFKARYTDALAKVNVQLDPTFASRAFAIRARSKLPPEQLATFDEIFQREVGNAFTPGQGKLSGRDYKMLDERLGKIAADYQAVQGDPYTRLLGETIQTLKDQLAGLVRRQNAPQAARLRKLDEGYAQFVRMRSAAVKSPNDGVVSPNELMQAVRQSDRSVGKGATARGDALMQDLAADGQNVLPSSIGSSGTTERANLTDPIAWIAGLGLAPLFGRTGSEVFRKAAMKPRPLPAQVGANALRALPSGPIGGAAINALLAKPD